MLELSPQPTPVQSLYDWYRNGILIVNRTYQRKLVWTLEEKQKLIDSILNQYPIPLILLAERRVSKRNDYELIDGLQRLHAIVSFIENEFTLRTGESFDTDQFAAAKNASTDGLFESIKDGPKLSAVNCSKILNYVMSLSIMRNGTSNEIYDVFNRINSYGHRLSEQERRQAGLVTGLSNLVRQLACEIRGDASDDVLPLFRMPEISIDLPKTRHGYSIKADNTFWVKHGILRSTDLRDSMDEHVLSDIIACIVNGGPIERSKQALDDVYDINSTVGKTVNKALLNYGSKKVGEEIKFIISEIDRITAHKKPNSLRTIIFKNKNTNAYPTVFATLCLAFHRQYFNLKNNVSDTGLAYSKLENIAERIKTGPGATSEKERKTNVDTVAGLIGGCFVKGDVSSQVYGHPSNLDFENMLRQAPIEHSFFEFKQGLLSLGDKRVFDKISLSRIIETICAIANCGPHIFGHMLIGVCDKREDAVRIQLLDAIEPLDIDGRYIVGITREAALLGKKLEDYIHILRDGISSSSLSDPLKGDVLNNLSVLDYFGRDVIHIGIPKQKEISWVGETTFYREVDQTKTAGGKKVAELASRFK